jgi:sensor c-di-GMP phosphodiesterase-like protein
MLVMAIANRRIMNNARVEAVSAEALVRIRDVDGSIIPPGKFIPVAEETGLVEQLGVHYIQGLYFSKPLPQEEFVAFVRGSVSGA